MATFSAGSLPSRVRGLYHRVAKRLGVDASYVSRVARGQRRSAEVSQALLNEIERLFGGSPTYTVSATRNGNRQLVLEKQLAEASGKLLKTQLDAAFLFLETARVRVFADQEVRRRNLLRAKAGCERSRSLLRQVHLSPSDASEIHEKLQLFEVAFRQVNQELQNLAASPDFAFISEGEITRKWQARV